MFFIRLIALGLILFETALTAQENPDKFLKDSFRLHENCEITQLVQKCDDAIHTNPRDGVAYALRGFAATEIPDYEKANADTLKAIELEPENATVLALRGATLGSQLRIHEAIDILKKSVAREPGNVIAGTYLAHTYYFDGQFAMAQTQIERVIESNADFAMAWYVLANVHSAFVNRVEARKAFSRAFELNPGFVKALIMRGYDHIEIQQPEKAIPLAEEAIAANPESHFGYSFLAYARVSSDPKLIEDALHDLEKAIELAPKHFDPWSMKADCLFVAGRFDDAMVAINRALELKPRHPYSKMLRAAILVSQEKYDDALRVCDQVEDLYPNFFRPAYYRGYIYLYQDELGEAWLELDQAEKLFPEYPYIYSTKSICHSAPSPFQLLEINKAIDLVPDHGWFYHLRGEIYGDLGLPDRAEADYARAKELGYEPPPSDGDM